MLQQNQTIKSWAEDDRPREKLLLKGRLSLTDSELIAILLQTGTKDKSAVDLAKELLALSGNSLHQFARQTIADFCKVKGIGQAKAITLIAAMELGRRRKDMIPEKKIKLVQSETAYNLLRNYLEDLAHEEFYIIFLNRGNYLIKIKQLSVGGLTGTVVDTRLIFKEALDCLASAIILAHNHPSGQPNPSEQDITLTSRIQKVGNMMEIQLIDHLIITSNGYFSFADKGLM